LEETQKDIELLHGELLRDILIELKKLNVHMAHLSDQNVTDQDIEEHDNVY
jgi:hypothetical protein